jgi:hypothetical protein
MVILRVSVEQVARRVVFAGRGGGQQRGWVLYLPLRLLIFLSLYQRSPLANVHIHLFLFASLQSGAHPAPQSTQFI